MFSLISIGLTVFLENELSHNFCYFPNYVIMFKKKRYV